MAWVRRIAPLATILFAAAITPACSWAPQSQQSPQRSSQDRSTSAPQPLAPAPAAPSSEPTRSASPRSTSPATSSAAPTGSPSVEPRGASEPRVSFLTIPALGMRDFPVRRYPGSPDDAAGTAIQNNGDMASPRGVSGGVGPGEIGNYIVTGHRLSSTRPFRYLPSVPDGSRVLVRAGDDVHVYELRRTRWTSFRSSASLAAQRAPVPGRPGVSATRPMITLSTCATVEDHAAGNFWSDEFDNPEHRIDRIGVLIATRPA